MTPNAERMTNSRRVAGHDVGLSDHHRTPGQDETARSAMSSALPALVFALFAALPLTEALTLDLGFPLTPAHILSVPVAGIVLTEAWRRGSLAVWIPLLPFAAFWLIYVISFAANVGTDLPQYEWATGRNAPGIRSLTKVLWLAGNIAIALVIANAILTRTRATAAVAGLLTGAAITALYGLYQTIGQSHGFYLPLIPGTEFVAGTPSIWIVPRAASAFLEPSFFGAYLGAVLPFAMAALADRAPRHRRHQAWLWVALTLILAGTTVTFSVAGIISAGVAGISLLFLRMGRDAGRMFIHAAAAAILAAVVLWVAVPGLDNAMLALAGKGTAAADVVFDDKLGDPDDPASAPSDVSERSAVERVATNSAAIAIFADHPLLGVGPGNFGFWYPEYRPAGVEAPDQLLITNNVYAELLAEAGLLGLTAFLAAAGFVVVVVVRRTRQPGGDSRFVAAATASLAAIGAVLLLAPSFTVLYQWALIGLAVGISALASGRLKGRADTSERIRPPTNEPR